MKGKCKLTQEKVNIVLDASKIDLFEACPKRYELRYIRNKSLPIIHKNKSLDLGGLAHEGLAVYYSLLKDGVSYEERVKWALMKVRQVSSDVTESNVEIDEVSSLLKTIEENLDFWRPEDENCLEILAVEQPFAYILYEDDTVRIIISGKIDILVNHHGIGRQQSLGRVPIDHKTYSRDSMVLRKSNQFINYASVIGSNYLIVNRIGLHSHDTKKPLSAEEKYKRPPLSYDPIYIQEWKDNLIRMLLQEYLTCLASGAWPEKPTSCNKFNRLCEYYDVCDSSGQDAKEFKLESRYVEAKEWDVTKSLIGEQ